MSQDYSLNALSDFYTKAAERGYLPKNTAQSLKTAATKVLECLDPENLLDLRGADIDQAFNRFQNINKSSYTPSSLKVYDSRARVAVKQFIRWVENPSGWTAKSAPRKKDSKPERRENTAKAVNTEEINKAETSQIPTQSATTESLQIPIPLRPGMLIWLRGIPQDLTIEEADKISAIITAYATQKN